METSDGPHLTGLCADEKGKNSQTFVWGFPGGSDGKESACSAGDPGSTPGQGTKIPQATPGSQKNKK